MRLVKAALICSVLLGSLTAPLSAQHPSPRHGLWLGAGVGFGFARARCDVCSNNRDGGLSGYARLGGTVRPSLLLGIEGNGWTHNEENLNFDFGALTAVASWYPSPRTPWFLKGGFGFVAYRVDDDNPDTDAVTASSFGGQFGAGYDLPIGGNLSLTPYVNFIGSVFADLESQGDRLADVTLTLLQVGLGLTFH